MEDLLKKINDLGGHALKDIISYELSYTDPSKHIQEIIISKGGVEGKWDLSKLTASLDGKYYFDPQDWEKNTDAMMLKFNEPQGGGAQTEGQGSSPGPLPKDKVSELFHGWLTSVKNIKKTSIHERNIDIAESLSNFFKLFIETHKGDGAYFVFCETRLICFIEAIGLTSEIQGNKSDVNPGKGIPAAPPFCKNPPPGTDDELCNKHCTSAQDNKKCKDMLVEYGEKPSGVVGVGPSIYDDNVYCDNPGGKISSYNCMQHCSGNELEICVKSGNQRNQRTELIGWLTNELDNQTPVFTDGGYATYFNEGYKDLIPPPPPEIKEYIDKYIAIKNGVEGASESDEEDKIYNILKEYYAARIRIFLNQVESQQAGGSKRTNKRSNKRSNNKRSNRKKNKRSNKRSNRKKNKRINKRSNRKSNKRSNRKSNKRTK